MRSEKIFMVAAAAVLCATMLLRPRLLALTRRHRSPVALRATRATGALGLLGIVAMLIARYMNG